MSYSRLADHQPMVFDGLRNRRYAEAIRAVIKPGSVVLDLGAGLGVLGLLAALAGASRVYLVEPESLVRNALQLAQQNGVADRITILQGRIEEVELPEQVDVIVSVVTGNLLFSEDLLPSLYHARDHWLKPGGCLLPDMAELMVAPVSAAGLHARHVGMWAAGSAGLDVSACRRVAANEMVSLEHGDARPLLLAEPAVMSRVDLRTANTAECRGIAESVVMQGGLCHGLLGWIRLRLHEHWLSSGEEQERLHWSPILMPVDPPLLLETGEAAGFSLDRPARGDWTWTLKSKAGSRRHSTFLAGSNANGYWQRMAESNRERLNRKGELLLDVLQLMQAGHSNNDIAGLLLRRIPPRFADHGQALGFVQSVAMSNRRP